MSFKVISFDIDESIFKKLGESVVEQALQRTMEQAYNFGLEMAKSRLTTSLRHWENGYSTYKLSADTWVISLSGELANMFEDGGTHGQIKNMLLSGKKDKTSKNGTKYINVPIQDHTQSGGANVLRLVYQKLQV